MYDFLFTVPESVKQARCHEKNCTEHTRHSCGTHPLPIQKCAVRVQWNEDHKPNSGFHQLVNRELSNAKIKQTMKKDVMFKLITNDSVW